MKIVVISCHPLQDNRISKMIRTVLEYGHSVVYINSSSQKECSENWFGQIKVVQFDVDFVKKNLFEGLDVLRRIAKTVKKERPDIVHIHDPYMLPILKISKKIGAKTVYDKHEAFEVLGGISGKLAKILEVIYKKKVDGVVYVAKPQEHYLAKCGYKNQVYIPNYQSRALFEDVTIQKRNGIQLFYAGDLSNATRNTSLMLMLMNKTLAEFDNTRFVLAGKTTDEEIVQQIKELEQYGDRFQYVPYMLYHDVIKNTKESDIGLYLTKFDLNNIGSSPNKINEYLLAGIAVFSQGRYADWEQIDGKAGRVYDYDAKFDEMYRGLKEMIQDSDKLCLMKEKSKVLGVQRTWEMVESRYQDLYEQIMDEEK